MFNLIIAPELIDGTAKQSVFTDKFSLGRILCEVSESETVRSNKSCSTVLSQSFLQQNAIRWYI